MLTESGHPKLPVFLVILGSFLFFQIFSNSFPASPQRFWQAILQIKVEGEFVPSPGLSAPGKFMVEAEWPGFLEEDGPDFIIYHFDSHLNNWKLWTEENGFQKPTASLIRPVFCVDYVEGLEKEIRFYYSFRPAEIDWPGENTPVPSKLLLPSAPWPLKKDPGLQAVLKTTGSRIITLERTALENPIFQREFSWQAEIFDRVTHQKIESFSVWLKLQLKELPSRNQVRPGDEIYHKPVSAFPD